MSGAGYSYTVNITYQSGETKEIFKEYFKMKYERKATYSMENYIALPERVMEGTDYRVNGVIQANYPISSIWVSIKQISSGKETICENPQPFTYSYDLSDVADKFDFSSLEEGTYNYTIRVYIGAQQRPSVIRILKYRRTTPKPQPCIQSIAALTFGMMEVC